jgi:hypothetical protein
MREILIDPEVTANVLLLDNPVIQRNIVINSVDQSLLIGAVDVVVSEDFTKIYVYYAD